jgi:hypothetical protein
MAPRPAAPRPFSRGRTPLIAAKGCLIQENAAGCQTAPLSDAAIFSGAGLKKPRAVSGSGRLAMGLAGAERAPPVTQKATQAAERQGGSELGKAGAFLQLRASRRAHLAGPKTLAGQFVLGDVGSRGGALLPRDLWLGECPPSVKRPPPLWESHCRGRPGKCPPFSSGALADLEIVSHHPLGAPRRVLARSCPRQGGRGAPQALGPRAPNGPSFLPEAERLACIIKNKAVQTISLLCAARRLIFEFFGTCHFLGSAPKFPPSRFSFPLWAPRLFA